MSEEQKSKPEPKYGSEYEFYEALGKERFDALKNLNIDVRALDDTARDAVIGMTPEEIGRGFAAWKSVFRAEKKFNLSKLALQLVFMAFLLAAAFAAMAFAHTTDETFWVQFLVGFAYASTIVFGALAFDAAFPQYNLYEIIKDPWRGLVFTGFIFGSFWVGALSGAGSETANNGSATSPRAPAQEQFSSAEADSVAAQAVRQYKLEHGIDPEWRPGNEPQAQKPKRNSQSDSYQ